MADEIDLLFGVRAAQIADDGLEVFKVLGNGQPGRIGAPVEGAPRAALVEIHHEKAILEIAVDSAQSLTVGFLPEVRSWYALLYDHRTRPARRKRSPRHRAHHHRVASAELATRLLVDCQLEGTERCAAHRHCRKG